MLWVAHFVLFCTEIPLLAHLMPFNKSNNLINDDAWQQLLTFRLISCHFSDAFCSFNRLAEGFRSSCQCSQAALPCAGFYCATWEWHKKQSQQQTWLVRHQTRSWQPPEHRAGPEYAGAGGKKWFRCSVELQHILRRLLVIQITCFQMEYQIG